MSYQGNLASIDLGERTSGGGRISWVQEASTAVGLGYGFGNVYLASEDSTIEALNGSSGKQVWETDALLYRDITSPVAIGSYIAVGDFEGYLHLIAQSDGRFVGRRVIDKKGLNGPAVVDGRRIYLLGNSGRLSALEIN